MLIGAVLASIVAVAFVAGAAGGIRRRVAGGVLGILSIVWMFVNKPVEIGVLVYVDAAHGVTYADLVGVVGLALAVWCIWRPSVAAPDRVRLDGNARGNDLPYDSPS